MIRVQWNVLQGPQDPRWQDNCGLYAYLTTDQQEILYIGKVDGCTVRQRWNAPDKKVFWNALEKERNIFQHTVNLLRDKASTVKF